MKERPILFSGPMVRAILDGKKTQTRRVMKVQPGEFQHVDCEDNLGWHFWWDVVTYDLNLVMGADQAYSDEIKCPYGKPGDRLWVRECAWYGPQDKRVEYSADLDDEAKQNAKAWGAKHHPSIHMPRWASRITLEVTAVEVEQVQDIDWVDAKAEGVDIEAMRPVDEAGVPHGMGQCDLAIPAFRKLWDSINAKRGFSWESNPHVWVVEFERVSA